MREIERERKMRERKSEGERHRDRGRETEIDREEIERQRDRRKRERGRDRQAVRQQLPEKRADCTRFCLSIAHLRLRQQTPALVAVVEIYGYGDVSALRCCLNILLSVI